MTRVPLSIVHELLAGQHRTAAIQARRILRMKKLQTGVRTDRHVLDVGTGWGSSLALLREDYPQAEGIEHERDAVQWTTTMWQSHPDDIAHALACDPLAGLYAESERAQALERFVALKQELSDGGVDFSLGLPVYHANALRSCPGFQWLPYDCIVANICLDDLIEQSMVRDMMAGRMYGLGFEVAMESLAPLVRPGGLGIFTLFSTEFQGSNFSQDCAQWNDGFFRHPFMLYCMNELYREMGHHTSAEWSTDRGYFQGLTEHRARMGTPSWQFQEVIGAFAPILAPLATSVRAPLLYITPKKSVEETVKWAGVVDDIIKRALAEGDRLRPYESPGAEVYTLVFERK